MFTGDREAIFFFGVEVAHHLELVALGCESFGTTPADRGFALAVIAESAPPPPPEMRAKAGKVFAEAFTHINAFAVVIEGGGIVATTKRTMARVMVGLSRSRTPFRVYKNVAEALVWLREEAAAHGLEAFAHDELPERLSVA